MLPEKTILDLTADFVVNAYGAFMTTNRSIDLDGR